MHLNSMKFFHFLLGTVLFVGYVTCPLIDSFNTNMTIIVDVYMRSTSLIILIAATNNLLLGCYINAKRHIKHFLQWIASLLAALGGGFSLILLATSLSSALITTCLAMLVVSLFLQFFIHINTFFSTHNHIDHSCSDREQGTVKWFNNTKGFGFITRDQGSDIFVHYRAIRGKGHRTLIEGQRVEFVIAQKDKGLQAEDVVVAI